MKKIEVAEGVMLMTYSAKQWLVFYCGGYESQWRNIFVKTMYEAILFVMILCEQWQK